MSGFALHFAFFFLDTYRAGARSIEGDQKLRCIVGLYHLVFHSFGLQRHQRWMQSPVITVMDIVFIIITLHEEIY